MVMAVCIVADAGTITAGPAGADIIMAGAGAAVIVTIGDKAGGRDQASADRPAS